MKTLRLIWPGILGAATGSLVTAATTSPLVGLSTFALTVSFIWLLALLIQWVVKKFDL